MRSFVILIVAASLGWLPGYAAGEASYAEETLDNGLRVVLIPHRANPMVASAVVVGAGVVHEPGEASGASHFLEHLLFNGTATRSQRQLYDDVDRIGAYNNATTREDHTLFTLLVAKEFAEQGLAIQADMLFHSTIPEESFEKERKIVLEELARDRTDASYDLEAAFRAFAFSGTPISRPVLGTEASLAAISREQVTTYYTTRYVPTNMVLVIMGDFDIGEMKAVVRRTFGAAAKGPSPTGVAGAWPAVPALNLLQAPAAEGPARLFTAFPFPADPWDATCAAAGALLAAASEGEDSPLRRALERRGVSPIATELELDTRSRPWTTVVFDAKLPDRTDPKAVLDALAEAIRATGPGGEARDRLDRVLAQEVAEAAIARDQIHYYVMLRSSMVLGAPEGFLSSGTRRLQALGPADWDAASARLQEGLAAVRARFTGPGVAEAKAEWKPGPAPAPPPRVPLRAGVFANGLRYVVRASDDSDVFALHLAFAPRSAAEPDGRDGITDALHRVMGRGTTVRDQAALEDRLARLGARVRVVDDPSVPFDDYYTTPEFSWLRLEVPAGQWREAVVLVAEMVRHPALTQANLDEARRDMLELVARGGGSPRAVAAGRLDAMLAPAHPMMRPVLGTAATLNAITLDDLVAYQTAAAVGRRTIVSAVGPIDADVVVRALQADFGALPEGSAPAPPAPPPVLAKPATQEVTLGKTQAYLAMGEVIDVAPRDRAALTVAVAMLSDRMAFDLRETRGLAYSVGASLRPWGGRWRFDVAIGTRADNLDAARDGIVRGIRAFRDASPDAADVARAINVVRGSALMRRMTRISLAYEAGLEALRGREPGDERRFIDALRAVTPDDVKRVARAYLEPDRLSQVVVR
jgi:zinc protease